MESYHLAQQGREGEAAIIPRHILDQSDARFKIENVTDSENNFTRFLVIRPSKESDHTLPGKDVKVSLYIMPAIDRPGILYEILREFYTSHINLVSVISRPTKKNMGTYNFYFELTGSYEQKDTILSAISRIHETYPAKIVGMYGIEKREA